MTPLVERPVQPIIRPRTGVALPMVMGALVLIGVLVAGLMFAALQEYRVGANTQHQTRAGSAAEFGLNRVTVEWDPANNNAMKTGDTLRRSFTLSSGGTANVLMTRLPGPFFWAVSEGSAGPSRVDLSARRHYGQLLQLDPPNVGFLGALTGRGNIVVGGAAYVSGSDYKPSGWANCPPLAAVPGVAMADTSGAKIPGCTITKTCVSGTPAFLETPAANDTATYFNYGSTSYQALAASASKVFPPNLTLTGIGPVVAGQCATSLLTNWGDANRKKPAGKCETYFPVMHAQGNLHISGGLGQGILLVDGDLQLSGSFWFVGVVIVRGTLRTTGSGAGVLGVVMAANVSLDNETTVIGNSYVQYSSCAVASALAASAMLTPVRQRAWVEVF